MLGENHFLWKGGLTTYRKLLMRANSPKACKRCNLDDLRVLAVHHIDKDRKNNKLENLAWLCHNCHYLIHHDSDELEKFNSSMN